MAFSKQQGWVAWAFSAVLFITTAVVGWLYLETNDALRQSQEQALKTQAKLDIAERNLTKESQARENITSEHNSLQTQIKTITANRDQLQSQLAQQQNATEHAMSEMARLEKANSEKEAQLTAAQQNLEELQQSLEESQNSIEALHGELSQASTVEEQYLAAREQLALQQAENESYSDTIAHLKTELDSEAKAMTELESKLQEQLSQLNQEKQQLVTQLEDGTTAIKLPESILFASGSADLNKDGLQALDVLASALQSFPNHLISVQGHTDSQKISPNTALLYPTNWELSTARAAVAVRELIAKGIPAGQLQATGFADTRPLVEETDSASRQQNRRIEVILFPNQFKTKVLQSD